MRPFFILFFSIIFFASSAFAREQLIIEPDMGIAPISAMIADAKSSVDLVTYGFTEKQLISAFINAKKRGKNVSILLEPHPYKAEDENISAIQQFHTANINVLTPNPDVRLTHQKTLITDQNLALIMTFNFTHSTFTKERNFGLIIDDPAMIQEIIRIFNADTQHKNISVTHPNLVWSPNNSREKILNFINDAHSEIKIYAQDVSDYQTIGALAKAARAGKKIQILMPEPRQTTHSKKFAYLKKAGIDIRFSKNYLIHAKVMIVDRKRAMLGSTNLTRSSINENRELSIITQDPEVIKELIKTFNQDWGSTSFDAKQFQTKISPQLMHTIKHLLRQLQ